MEQEEVVPAAEEAAAAAPLPSGIPEGRVPESEPVQRATEAGPSSRERSTASGNWEGPEEMSTLSPRSDSATSLTRRSINGEPNPAASTAPMPPAGRCLNISVESVSFGSTHTVWLLMFCDAIFSTDPILRASSDFYPSLEASLDSNMMWMSAMGISRFLQAANTNASVGHYLTLKLSLWQEKLSPLCADVQHKFV